MQHEPSSRDRQILPVLRREAATCFERGSLLELWHWRRLLQVVDLTPGFRLGL